MACGNFQFSIRMAATSGALSPNIRSSHMWTAGSMLTVIPVMILYVFASKYFIRGVAMTGIKG